MPRPPTDLTPYKDTILGLYEGGCTPSEIATYLQGSFPLPPLSDRTVRRRLEAWSAEYAPRRQKSVVTLELRKRIRMLFNGEEVDGVTGEVVRRRQGGERDGGAAAGLGDEEILEVLRGEGWRVAMRALVRVRKEEGLVRRGRGDWEEWERERSKRNSVLHNEMASGREEDEDDDGGIEEEEQGFEQERGEAQIRPDMDNGFAVH